MEYEIEFDEDSCSVIITNLPSKNWFVLEDTVYNVEPYDGVLKHSSINLDVLVPINNFKDYVYIYSNVFIDELNYFTDNTCIGHVFWGISSFKKQVLPILNEVYETHNKKTINLYFEDIDGHVKYIFIDIIYENGHLLIFYNNTTDPLLKSQQDVTSDANYVYAKSYSFVKDMKGNYFWGSNISNLIEREKITDDYSKDIIEELIIPDDKMLYSSLLNEEVETDNVVHILTVKGNKKTLKVKSKHLHTGGALSHIAVYLTDITDSIDSKDERLINVILKKLDAKLGAGHFVKTTKGEYVVSNAFYDILHISKNKTINLANDFKDYVLDKEDQIEIEKFLLNKVHRFEKVIKFKSPSYSKVQHVFVYLEHYKDESSNLIFLGIKDLTEEHLQRQELSMLYDTLRDAEDSNKFSIQFMDNEGRYHWTPGMYEILERNPLPKDKFKHILLEATDEETRQMINSKMEALKPNELIGNHEIKITTAKGNIKYVLINIKQVYDDDRFIQRSCYARDITEEYLTREALIQADNDKTVLVQEVHHRVKNNLQLIRSFINLEKKFRPGDFENILDVTEDRITSLALIHERIYNEYDMNYIVIPQFIEDFDNNLYVFSSSNDIRFVYDIPKDLTLAIDIVTPLSLMINELTTNTFKYAFNDDSFTEKIIYKSLNLFKKDGETFCRFEYKDNGVGLPEGFDISTSKSLGWRIISSLSGQIDGEYEIINENGLGFVLIFPIK